MKVVKRDTGYGWRGLEAESVADPLARVFAAGDHEQGYRYVFQYLQRGLVVVLYGYEVTDETE